MQKKKILIGNMQKDDAITLIALIITIIILIILAGVGISLALGENGIKSKAEQAKEDYKHSINIEEEQLRQAEEILNNNTKIVAGTEVEKPIDYIDNKNVKAISDGEGNVIPVPIEFYYVGGKKDTGFVISDIKDDDLNNSKCGNQFVWIPVDNINDYRRINFGKQYGNYSDYSEILPADEEESVKMYKGYYIGRYETGDKESTENKILRTSGASVGNKVTIKKGQAPYNWVTIAQSKILAESMKNQENYSATTKLSSSYAWDTALNFIQKTNSEYVITSSKEGNYKNTTFNYIDITGQKQIKENDLEVLVPTGQTNAVNNIYDLGGNVWEWTTEITSINSYPYTYRGGEYNRNSEVYSAGYRDCNYGSRSDFHFGFRITLYM